MLVQQYDCFQSMHPGKKCYKDFYFSLHLLLDMSSFDFFVVFYLSFLIILYFFLFIFHFETGRGQSFHILFVFQIMPKKWKITSDQTLSIF